jgi:hypothetical protein
MFSCHAGSGIVGRPACIDIAIGFGIIFQGLAPYKYLTEEMSKAHFPL